MSKLTVYSTTSCQQCRMTYRVLDKKGIPYDVVNVEENPEAAEKIKAMGYTQAPVVVLGCGRHWGGFRPDLLDELKAPNVPEEE